MRTDFPKFFRKFIIVAVLAVIFSGAAAGIAFRAQIAEIVSYEKLTEVQDGRYDALDKGSIRFLVMIWIRNAATGKITSDD